ncbi:hypothetical protein ACHAQJ_005235 [Trichoderma viride]
MFLAPLAEDDNALLHETRRLVFYRSVSPDPELRKASIQAQVLFDDFSVKATTNEDLYKLLIGVEAKEEPLSPEDSYFLHQIIRARVRTGLSIDADSTRDQFQSSSIDLAASRRNSGSDIEVKVTLQDSIVHRILVNVHSDQIRKRVYIAKANRSNENAVLFNEVIILRHKIAQLLKYTDYATFVLEDRMAESPSNVNTYLHKLDPIREEGNERA